MLNPKSELIKGLPLLHSRYKCTYKSFAWQMFLDSNQAAFTLAVYTVEVLKRRP